MEQLEAPEPHEPGPFWTGERLAKLVVFALGVLLIFAGFLYAELENLNDRQTSGDAVTLENTAQLCRIQLALEVRVNDRCRDPRVTRYYDPDEPVSNFRTQLRDILCFLQDEAGGRFNAYCGR